MPAPLDLGKLAAVLGMLGSNGDGEVLNAARLANRMIRAAGMQWADFIEAARRCEEAEARAGKLYDAAVLLQRERDQARTELQRLRQANGHASGLAAALWADTGAPRTAESRHAVWVLSLGLAKGAGLSRQLQPVARAADPGHAPVARRHRAAGRRAHRAEPAGVTAGFINIAIKGEGLCRAFW